MPARVAVVVPNLRQREGFTVQSDPPIGAAVVAGALERAGHDTIVVDAMAEDLTPDAVLRRLVDHRSEAVGVSCNYCTVHNPTLDLARAVRQALGPGVLVFAGGNHAASLAEVLLRQSGGALDAVARGEGETVAPLLLEARAAGADLARVPGLVVLRSGRAVATAPPPLEPDLDRLGLPAYHLLPMASYDRYNVVSMRGCPYSCSFCASTAIFGRRVRYRSPASILAEVELLLRRHGPRHFWFSDDTFTANRRHTEELLRALLAARLDLSWSCLTTVTSVRPELLALMREAGCQYVSYGIESGSTAILAAVGKRISPRAIVETSRATRAAGLRHFGFFILGLPGESWDTVYDTCHLIYASELDGGGMNVLVPLPGTRLWRELHDERRLFSVDELRWDEMFARVGYEARASYPAELAARWCGLAPEELLEACRLGERMLVMARHRRERAGGGPQLPPPPAGHGAVRGEAG